MTSSPPTSIKLKRCFQAVDIFLWGLGLIVVIWGLDLIWSIECLPRLQHTQVRKLSTQSTQHSGIGSPTAGSGSDGN